MPGSIKTLSEAGLAVAVVVLLCQRRGRGGTDQLLQCCEQLDVEGLVAKRLGSPYRPGKRSGDWVKIKTATWRTVHAPYRHNR